MVLVTIGLIVRTTGAINCVTGDAPVTVVRFNVTPAGEYARRREEDVRAGRMRKLVTYHDDVSARFKISYRPPRLMIINRARSARCLALFTRLARALTHATPGTMRIVPGRDARRHERQQKKGEREREKNTAEKRARPMARRIRLRDL